jgi:hypothetical protein
LRSGQDLQLPGNLFAEVAQLVERNLAKVEVAGSNLVFRSKGFHPAIQDGIFV